jgi:putative ABC transport system permease protein
MKVLDIIKTASGNIRRSKLRSFLTVIAVVIGSFTLSLTNALGNGAKDYINRELQNVAAKDSLSIHTKPVEGDNPLERNLREYNPDSTREFGFDYLSLDKVDEIRRVTGATKVTPIYGVTAEYVAVGDKKYEAQMTTYPPGMELSLLSGQLLNEGDIDAVLLPQDYAKAFFDNAGNAVGKSITIFLKEPTGETLEVQAKVAGVLGSSIVFNNQIYGHEKLMARLNAFQTKNVEKLQNKVQTVVANLPAGTSDQRVKEIMQELDRQGYRGATLEDQISSVKDTISTAQLVLNLFGGVALLAASFGIINTLLMSVYERTREIGLLKALGASKRLVFAIFAFEAISIGFWGGLIGIGLSMIAGLFINSMASASFLSGVEGLQLLVFPSGGIIMVLLLIMAIAFVAGALPARKASRMNPIDALRYE